MTWVQRHIAVIAGEQAERVPGASLDALAPLLARLRVDLRRAVNMAVLRRSSGKASGQLKFQLAAAGAAGITDLEPDGKGRATLWLRPLGDAMPDVFRQAEFWPSRPDPEWTAFDLLASVVEEISAGKAESNLFDESFLHSIGRYSQPFREQDFSGIQFVDSRLSEGTILNEATLQVAAQLSRKTPSPQIARLEGKLDTVRLSGRCFELLLETGDRVSGVLLEGDPAELSARMGTSIAVGGQAIWKASGHLLRVDATSIEPVAQSNAFFSQVPVPISANGIRRYSKRLTTSPHLQELVGSLTGPGESDAEFWAAVEELS